MPSDTLPEDTEGAAISPSNWCQDAIAIDDAGRAHVTLGFVPEGWRGVPRGQPWLAPHMGARYPEQSYRYVGLRGGDLFLGSFLGAADRCAVAPGLHLRLPRGPGNAYYAACNPETGREDIAITRQIFGCAHDELIAIARAIARTDLPSGPAWAPGFPSVTSSRKPNKCELGAFHIPGKFPYLSFGSALYAWSHVSLSGFFRFLRLLCRHHFFRPAPRSIFYRHLLDAGCPQEPLDNILTMESTSRSLLPRPDAG